MEIPVSVRDYPPPRPYAVRRRRYPSRLRLWASLLATRICGLQPPEPCEMSRFYADRRRPPMGGPTAETPEILRSPTRRDASPWLRSWLRAVAVGSLLFGVSASAQAVEVSISATSPHRANGVDRSSVLIMVTDDTGQPVTNAEIELDIRPPHFASQA